MKTIKKIWSGILTTVVLSLFLVTLPAFVIITFIQSACEYNKSRKKGEKLKL